LKVVPLRCLLKLCENDFEALVKEMCLHCRVGVFPIRELGDWYVRNQNPALDGRFVAHTGVNISYAEIEGPRAFISAVIRKVRFIGAKQNRY
jgi:hypothetical protein